MIPPPFYLFYVLFHSLRKIEKPPLHVGEPDDSRKLDKDGDGIACEK
ncbi:MULTISPECIES: excalibur calcium-binding domain-containing protein [unclassified Bacillus (in: Bacteria)]